MGGRARCSAWSWALGLFFAWRCVSVEVPHPTPEHKIAGCYVACPFGYSSRRQHLCRSDRRQFKSILITGEETNPGDPSDDRWITGVTSIGVERIVLDRMKAEGITPTDSRWSPRYAEIFDEIRAEVGNDAVESFNKQDVELCPCEAYMHRLDASRAAEQRGLPERTDSRPPNQP